VNARVIVDLATDSVHDLAFLPRSWQNMQVEVAALTGRAAKVTRRGVAAGEQVNALCCDASMAPCVVVLCSAKCPYLMLASAWKPLQGDTRVVGTESSRFAAGFRQQRPLYTAIEHMIPGQRGWGVTGADANAR
jgi:hypothetical protein